MTNGVLHREIREKGGAYGGGAVLGYDLSNSIVRRLRTDECTVRPLISIRIVIHIQSIP